MKNKNEQINEYNEDQSKKDPWGTILSSYNASLAEKGKGTLSQFDEDNQPLLYKRIPLLEAIYDKFQRSLTSSMHDFIDDNAVFNITFQNLNSLHFENYLQSIDQPGVIGVFKAKEWQSEGLIFIHYNVVAIIVDALSGGKYNNQTNFEPSRQYSKLEKKIIEKIFNLILVTFSDAFLPLCKVSFSLEKIENDLNLARITKNTSIVTVARFSFEVGSSTGFIEVIIPYATLEPIKSLLVQNFMGEKFGDDPVWEQHMTQQLLATDITLEIKLPEAKATLKEILQWKIGTKVPFDCTEESLMGAFCENHKIFTGKIGQKRKKVAFCINEVFFKEKGEHP
jgi:flagellar motor switch protein FliM